MPDISDPIDVPPPAPGGAAPGSAPPGGGESGGDEPGGESGTQVDPRDGPSGAGAADGAGWRARAREARRRAAALDAEVRRLRAELERLSATMARLWRTEAEAQQTLERDRAARRAGVLPTAPASAPGGAMGPGLSRAADPLTQAADEARRSNDRRAVLRYLRMKRWN